MDVKTYQNLNLDYLHLMTDGDAEMQKMMLDILFEELPQEIELLTTHFQAQEWDDLKSISHKLKSTLAFIGNDPMTFAIKQIEHNAMYVENTDEIPKHISKLNELYPIVISELKAYYSSL